MQLPGDAPSLGFLQGDQLTHEFLARSVLPDQSFLPFRFGLMLQRDIAPYGLEFQETRVLVKNAAVAPLLPADFSRGRQDSMHPGGYRGRGSERTDFLTNAFVLFRCNRREDASAHQFIVAFSEEAT